MQLLTLLPFALSALCAPITERSTESWNIPTMDVHFMGRDTGIPGNQWPDSQKFNSTLDFTLNLPSSEVRCSAIWPYLQVSTDEWPCQEGAPVSFRLSPLPTGAISDAAWTLTITSKEGGSTYVATQVIVNNEPGLENSYLTCIGGKPYDGVRCKLNGWAGKKGPIVLAATSQ